MDRKEYLRLYGKHWQEVHRHPCFDCGKSISDNATRCRSCANKNIWKLNKMQNPLFQKGVNNPHWKGGKYKDKNGYIHIKTEPDDFFYPMVGSNGYISEHRLVIAKQLNRCLLSWEVVHHKNGIQDDNRWENLELLPSKKYHIVDSLTKGRIVQLEKRVTILETENELLKKQIRESQWSKI